MVQDRASLHYRERRPSRGPDILLVLFIFAVLAGLAIELHAVRTQVDLDSKFVPLTLKAAP